MIELIGLSGYARSGKDTIADALVVTHGYTKTSFADPMREALLRLNPTIDMDGYRLPLRDAVRLAGWDALKSMSGELRPLLQRMGTDVGRDMLGQDIWVEYAMSRLAPGQRTIFADVRFPNEADAIKLHGGQVWRVERPGVEPANDHISEHALDDYDFDQVIVNDVTLANLFIKVGYLAQGGAA